MKKVRELPELTLSMRRSLRPSFSEADYSNDIHENFNKMKLDQIKEKRGDYELLINENPFLTDSPLKNKKAEAPKSDSKKSEGK